MLTQLDVFVIFVMALNLNAVIHKMIAWQLDTFLLSSAKQQMNSGQLHWVGEQRITNTMVLLISPIKTPSTDGHLLP